MRLEQPSAADLRSAAARCAADEFALLLRVAALRPVRIDYDDDRVIGIDLDPRRRDG